MIATRRGLLVLLVAAIVLGAWLTRALTRPRGEPVDRAIVPGFDAEGVSELVWERESQPPLKVTPAKRGEWRWESGEGRAVADGSAVRDVLAALRAGRWHRRADATAAGNVSSRLTVKVGTASRTIGIGQPFEGTEQQWLVAGENALLVDRWVARALDPGPFALRGRHLVEDVHALDALGVVLDETRIELQGRPLRLKGPFPLLPRQELLAAFVRAIDALELVRLSRPPPAGASTMALDVGDHMLVAPTCPDEPALAWIASTLGRGGCIARAQYDQLHDAVTALVDGLKAFATNPSALVESRPVPFDIDAVILVDGARLDLTKRPEIGGRPVDNTAVSELLAALGAPAQVQANGTEATVATLRIQLRGGGEIALAMLGRGRTRRDAEPVVLQLAPAAYAALNRHAADLADRAVWTEEPSTISELSIDGVTYRRGAVVGEWTRTPAGPVDGPRIEALVTALAAVRGSPTPALPGKQHDVAIVVTPPAGAVVRHELVVGAPRGGGCPASAGQVTVTLPATVCAEISALAR